VSGDLTFDGDDTISVVVARPTAARPAAMLQRDAVSWAGWPLFEPETQARARQRCGIPRPVSDLRGEVLDASWDRAQGAVVARVRVTDQFARLLKRLPHLVRFEARPMRRCIEIVSRRSGSAPGALIESYINPKEPEMKSMTLGEALRRPEVIGHLRRELGLPEPPHPAPVAPVGQTRGAALLESVIGQPPPGRQAPDDGLRDLFARRGLDPARFGMAA
jgi:hypothetical protein